MAKIKLVLPKSEQEIQEAKSEKGNTKSEPIQKIYFKVAENIQQALQITTSNPQLEILSAFSNDQKEDKSSGTEWFQKLLNNKQGAESQNSDPL
jgi:hypothetical protein